MAEEQGFRTLLSRALLCRCPRCGKAPVYKSFLTFADHCAACRLPIAKNDNGDGPAVFLIFILGFTLVPIALFVAMHTDWPLWLHALIWSVLVTGCTLALLRPAKALTLGLQYRYKKESFDGA